MTGFRSVIYQPYSPAEGSVVDDVTTGELAHQLSYHEIRLLRPILLQARVFPAQLLAVESIY